MSLYCATGSIETDLSPRQLQNLLAEALAQLGPRNRVLVVPPDQSREHSRAGELTSYAWQYYGDRLKAVLPALGTHTAMRPDQIAHMFGDVPQNLFRIHNWRTDVETLGEVPSTFIHEQSEGKLSYAWPAQVNRLISQGNFDLILSIGQVVPHEVIGMANYTKNILVGTGGREGINRSHYLGAVYGMERIMGRAENPVRSVLNYASDRFLRHLPIVYVLTVVAFRAEGGLAVRGLFIGDDAECFHLAADLSLKVNFEILDTPLKKAVVYLDPGEFHSTWLGNKAVYRTRMALADGANLANDLSAAAHLIHGSSEGRFNITWCPGHLTRQEVESVGFNYADLNTMLQRYDPEKLTHGYNQVDGEDIFFIANPGLGLWAHRSRL